MIVVSIILIVIVLIAALLSKQSKESKIGEQAFLKRKESATWLTNHVALELPDLIKRVNETDNFSDYYYSRDRAIKLLKLLAEDEQYVNPHPVKPLPSVVLVQMDDVYDAQVEDIIKKTYEKAEHDAQTYGSSCSTYKYSSSFMTETSKYLDRMSEGNKKYVEECHNKLLQIEDTTNFIENKATEAKVLNRQMNESWSLSAYFTCRDNLIELFKQLVPVENDITQYQINPPPSEMLKRLGDSIEQDVHFAIQRAYEYTQSNIHSCVSHSYSEVFMSDVDSCKERISDSNKKFASECYDKLRKRESEAFYSIISSAERLRSSMMESDSVYTYIRQRNELISILRKLVDVEDIVAPFPMKPLPSELLRQLSGDENTDISRAIQVMYESLCLTMMSYPQDDQLTMSDMQDYRLMRNDEHDYKLIECAKKNVFSKLFAQDIKLCQTEVTISQEILKKASAYVKELEQLEHEILRLGEKHISNIASELKIISEKRLVVSGKIEETDGMDGHIFEHWCADLLEKSGFYDVEVTQGSGDQGVDITAVKDEIHYAIQCKCYSSDIGNKPIQEVYAGKEMYQCQVGVVMTNSYFTAGAKQLADKTRVLLWDRDKLSKMLEKVMPEVENDITEPFSTDAKAIDLDSIEDLLQRETDIRNSSESVNVTKSKDYGTDDMIERAIAAVVEAGQASTSFLQRRLKINYARAARTIDELEEMGIIGSADGSRPRQVLMTKAQWLERKNSKNYDTIQLCNDDVGSTVEKIVSRQATEIKLDNQMEIKIVNDAKIEPCSQKLSFTVGKDPDGKIVTGDILQLKHILVVGNEDSGKSAFVNSIITDVIGNTSPNAVKFVLIDSERLEFSNYNSIPHLLIPVIIDAKKAVGALGWSITEMLKRYDIFADNNVGSLEEYNRLSEKNDSIQPIPQIVIVVSELTNLMTVAPKDVEESIYRLTRLAHFVGIHLIIETQSLKDSILSDSIKDNFPSRVVFRALNWEESEAVLGERGAENLSGNNDFWYKPAEQSKPIKIQGNFVTTTSHSDA